jgi:hypothetical protein
MNLTRGLYIALGSVLIFGFFFGPLNVFIPIKMGFESIKHEKARIYIDDVKRLPAGYNKIDEYMHDFQEELGFTYTRPIQVVITKNKGDFRRFLLWIDPEKVEAKTLPFGNTIYINSELIREEGYQEETFLKGELIHELIYQNTNFLNATTIDNQMWVSDGLSLYYAGLNYYSDTKFRQLFQEANPTYSEISFTLYTSPLNSDRKFINTLYKNLMSYIITTYGKDEFREFFKSYLDSPARFRKIFSDSYGKSMSEVMHDFELTYSH